MDRFNIDALVEDDNFYVELNSNVWLMDNHRWAFYIWEKHRQKSDTKKFSLIHTDYHWDSEYDFYESPEEENQLLYGDLDVLFAFVKEGNWIRYDSFITPAVMRGYLSEIHFFCKQDDDWDSGIEVELLQRTGTTEFRHESVEYLSQQQYTCPIIFDLCLDLFNNHDEWYQGNLWSEFQIMDFLMAMKEKIIAAEVITVSLSFGYSGTVENTQNLAKLVIPLFIEWRK